MQKRPLTDNLPDYETVQRFLRILAGTKYSDYVGMMNDIWAHIGSPKSQVNWKNPDEWIQERLDGESRKLASRLWIDSDNLVNPRHSYDMRAFCSHHALAVFSNDVVALTQKGKDFIDAVDRVIKSIDESEGITFILSEIMKHGRCKRLDLIEAFTYYCHTYTTWKAKASIDSALSARFRHLRKRELIERSGHAYEVTDAGLAYLRRVQPTQPGPNLTVAEQAKRANDQARLQLGDYLQEMDPYHFEHLIKRLLEAMNYDDVTVTKRAGDKGVDVVADIELGISRVREVVQVKRTRSNIGIQILNQLRGSIPLFEAVRGSIITLGGFTKQAKSVAIIPNVSPITLIDGDRLLDLLIEHDIGVRRSEIEVFEFDADSLSQFDTEENLDDVSSPQPESE